MKLDRRKGFRIFVSLILCVPLAGTLSCSYKENFSSFLEYERMALPIGEPLTFEIIGHRGYGSSTPENTLAALRRSIKEAVDFAEIDVRLTSDGIPVLLHDESVARTTGNPHQISDLSLAEVKKLDAGSYNSSSFKGEQIPSLEEALRLTRGKLKMLLHLKLPHSGPVIADIIRKTAFPLTDVLVMSDDFDTLKKMNTLMPGVGLVLLVFKLPVGASAQREYVEKQINAGATRTALALDVPDEEYMAVAHLHGLRVVFWTADNPYDSVEVDRFTADGVVTNKPLMWEDWATLIRKRG
jgi:glycerophosphoryl diester phosphodiesterase